MYKVQKSRLSRSKSAKEISRLGSGLFDQEIVVETEGSVSFIKAMHYFEGCVKTEASFFIRFEEMPHEHLRCLRSYYNTDKDWIVFKEIKNFWKIKS